MLTKILLTSFDIWKPEHTSNSSDDLLAKISELHSLPYSLTFLRKLPVDFELAPQQAIAKINQVQPDLIICCGMAESRQNLTIESTATYEENTLKTPIDLERLTTNLAITKISNEAGKFVCEALYYAILKHLIIFSIDSICIFIHVPVLTDKNTDIIISDFLLIMEKLAFSTLSNLNFDRSVF